MYKKIPLPDEKCFSWRKQRSSSKIKTTKFVNFKPETQTWVEVVTNREGTILVDPYTTSYKKVISVTGSRVADFKGYKPFRMLVANLTDN